MHRILIRFLLASLASLLGIAHAAEISQTSDSLQAGSLRAKNFYALTLFDSDPTLRRVLADNNALKTIQTKRAENMQSAQTSCKQSLVCELTPLVWSDQQIAAVSKALAAEYEASAAVRSAVILLRQSMAYQLYQGQDGQSFLASAWATCAQGLNEVITVYGLGANPLYPKIDSPTYDIHSATYRDLVGGAPVPRSDHSSSFFFQSLEMAVHLLNLNHRDESVRFDQVPSTSNRLFSGSTKSVDWKKYPYSVLLVPGQGPEDAATALAPMGRTRIALAAKDFHDGKAPFILVSGGFVHPSQTRYAEAIEMKDDLIREFDVPEEAIIVEPYARHTTTNIRNAVREIHRYGIPMDKPMLVVSDTDQIRNIMSTAFAARCIKELGYLQYRNELEISETEISALPEITSMEQNPLDPLDP